MKWVAKRRQGEGDRLADWIVVIPATPMYAEVVRLGRDGTPLHFWNEKSAQIHADSLNPKTVPLD